MSTQQRQPSPNLPQIRQAPQSPVGNCINCGYRLTYCGKPFTADVECSKCHVINHFRNSQQPIHVDDMDSLVKT